MGQLFTKLFQIKKTTVEYIIEHPKENIENAADALEKSIDNKIENAITSSIEKEVMEDGVHIAKELVVEKVESYLPAELLGNQTKAIETVVETVNNSTT